MGGGQQYFNGSIDQVRIFNKALSIGEVTTLNNETSASSTKSTTDIFDDSSGVALYELEGNANDTGRFGSGAIDAGQSAVFNGSSSKIVLPTSTFSPSTFTLSAWCNVTADTDENTIIELYDNQTYPNHTTIVFAAGSTTSSARFLLRNYTTNQYDYNPSGSVTKGVWKHYAMTYDGSTVKSYIDGSLVDSGSLTLSNPIGTISTIQLGLSSGTRYLNGKIDQVRIFNTALPQSAITVLYNETATTAQSASIDYVNTNPNSIAYYKMSDATDQLGNYNGTATNVNFNVAGKFGNAGEFNGSSSRIATNITNSVIPINSSFTISTWINTSATSGLIVAEGNWNAWSTAGFAIGMVSSNRVEASIANNGGAGGTQVVSSSIPLNTWVHIAATIDIGNFLKLYVDGSEVASTALSNNSRNNVSGGFYLGSDVSGFYFNGKIDQIRIYDSALSAANVTALYNEVEC
jgi:hypothetical protein